MKPCAEGVVGVKIASAAAIGAGGEGAVAEQVSELGDGVVGGLEEFGEGEGAGGVGLRALGVGEALGEQVGQVV